MLDIRKIKPVDSAKDVSRTFDRESIGFNTVGLINWEEYPYKPGVRFRIAHDGQNIYINWQVAEAEIKAVCDKDAGKVYKDSCVEFFVSFGEPAYYNIETNCIGKILMGRRTERHNRVLVASEETDKIKRWSSMGYEPVEMGSGEWELSLILPKDIFYLDGIDSFDNLTARGNFYKCGDDLRQRHYLTWNAIGSATPDFHQPEYFGRLNFE